MVSISYQRIEMDWNMGHTADTIAILFCTSQITTSNSSTVLLHFNSMDASLCHWSTEKVEASSIFICSVSWHPVFGVSLMLHVGLHRKWLVEYCFYARSVNAALYLSVRALWPHSPVMSPCTDHTLEYTSTSQEVNPPDFQLVLSCSLKMFLHTCQEIFTMTGIHCTNKRAKYY